MSFRNKNSSLKKLISVYVATVILVALTIGIGVTLYLYFSGYVSYLETKTEETSPIKSIIECSKARIDFYYNIKGIQKNYTMPISNESLKFENQTQIQTLWLSGWQYRTPITIDNTQNSNTLTDYQILVTINTQNLISQGKMRNNCEDIRFTDSDGITLLNYWIENPGFRINVSAFYGSGTTCISDMNNFPNTPNSYGNNDWWTYDVWSCDNCDYYVRIYFNFTGGLRNATLEVASDDGHAVWINGNYLGSAPSTNICHAGGTAQRSWDITQYIVQGQNEIRIWCSEAGGNEFCFFRLFINGQEIRGNGEYSQNTRIWVKVPNIPANSNKTIYLYYGNPSATSMSNGAGTFIFFDDFNDNDISDWSTNGWGSYNGDIIADNGKMRLRVYKCYNVEAYKDLGNINGQINIYFEWRTLTDYWYEIPGWKLFQGSTTLIDSELPICCACDQSGTNTTIISVNGQIRLLYRIYQSWACSYGDHGNTYLWIDNIRIRKYTSPEPTISLGNEEIQTNITTSITLIINSPLNTTYYSSSIPLNISAISYNSSALITVYLNNQEIYQNNLQSNTWLNISQTLTNLNIGTYNLTVIINNSYGLQVIGNVTFKIEEQPEEQGILLSLVNIGSIDLGNKYLIKFLYDNNKIESRNITVQNQLKIGDFLEIPLKDLPKGKIKKIEVYCLDVCPGLLVGIKSVNIEV